MQDIITSWLSWFPVTKLRPPSSQATIKRTWLTDQLYSLALTHRFTLISAPAGSGKTTLAADLAHHASEANVCWLSLDNGDSNLQTFLPTIAIALLADSQPDLIEIFATGQIEARQAANILINWLDQSAHTPLILILDDLHLLTDPDIHAFLDYLIERLPNHVHIVATTRYDPTLSLARLRARAELAELRLSEMRFSQQEAADYLNRLLGLDLPDQLVDQLYRRTEGWIAGLRLLALSLAHIDAAQRAQYIDELAQNDHYVFELLAEEVLAQQDEDIRRFLIETSILTELTPTLCQTVTGQADAAHILHQLHQRNLFLMAVGDGTYRYHSLFQDFLRDQLRQQPDHYREVHLRAANAHTHTVYAFQHYVAAEAWEEAIRVMRDGLKRDAVNCILTLVDMRMELFVKQLPPEIQDNNPWVLLVRGSLAVDRGLYQIGIPLIETARQLFHDKGDLDGELLADIQLFIPQIESTDDGSTYPRFVEKVRRYVPILTPEVHFVILLAGLWNSAWNYRHEQMERLLLEMTSEIIQHNNPISYRKYAQSIGHVLFFTPSGAEPFERVLPHLERHCGAQKSIIRMGVCNIRATLSLLRGDLAAARGFARESQAIIRYFGGFAWAESLVDAVLLASMLIQEDFEDFDRYYTARMPEMMRFDTSRQYLTEFMYLYGKRLLAQGRVEEARQVCEQMEGRYNFREFEGLQLALRGYVALYSDHLEEAEVLLLQANHIRITTRRYFPTSGGLGLALVRWRAGECQQALATLRDELAPIVAWNMPGLILLEGPALQPVLKAAAEAGIYPDFIERCLPAAHHNGTQALASPVDIPGSQESLTPREVDILRLIVDGASNRNIADTLYITENTVKSHVTRILGKLNARSRTEATARVRELGVTL